MWPKLRQQIALPLHYPREQIAKYPSQDQGLWIKPIEGVNFCGQQYSKIWSQLKLIQIRSHRAPVDFIWLRLKGTDTSASKERVSRAAHVSFRGTRFYMTFDGISGTPVLRRAHSSPPKRSNLARSCMNSHRQYLSHRTSKFSSNRHRKLQPFRET
ncbi:unnamed protein product [Hermetia illucens]|uniref:Uncharacterized protein n=1 Tax=Hermetia illucens TaxID=343691 RepID=A0A7R8UWM7_HERIL|nr:unnamed protein product [Hermetia illucens]